MAVYSVNPVDCGPEVAAAVSMKDTPKSVTFNRVFPTIHVANASGADYGFMKPGEKLTVVKNRTAGTAIKNTYNATGKASYKVDHLESRVAVAEFEENDYVVPGDGTPEQAIDAVNAESTAEALLGSIESEALLACKAMIGTELADEPQKLKAGTVCSQFTKARKAVKDCGPAIGWCSEDTMDQLAEMPELLDKLAKMASVSSIEDYITLPDEAKAQAVAKALGLAELVVYGNEYQPEEIPAGTVFIIGRWPAIVQPGANVLAIAKRKPVPAAIVYRNAPGMEATPYVMASMRKFFDTGLKDNVMDGDAYAGTMKLVASLPGHPGITYVTVDQAPGAYDTWGKPVSIKGKVTTTAAV